MQPDATQRGLHDITLGHSSNFIRKKTTSFSFKRFSPSFLSTFEIHMYALRLRPGIGNVGKMREKYEKVSVCQILNQSGNRGAFAFVAIPVFVGIHMVRSTRVVIM